MESTCLKKSSYGEIQNYLHLSYNRTKVEVVSSNITRDFLLNFQYWMGKSSENSLQNVWRGGTKVEMLYFMKALELHCRLELSLRKT